MRRVMVLALLACAASAAALALGATASPPADHGSHTMRMDAKPVTIASLKATFRGLLPATSCDAGKAKRASALKLRTVALKNVAKAPPKVLAKKKASMRRAIALLRAAKKACATPPAPAPYPPDPDPSGPPAPPSPPPPGATVITLHVTGSTLKYVETSATAKAGPIRIDLVNNSDFQHFASVRTAPMQPIIAETALSSPGQTKSVDLTLAAGSYQIFCHNNGHDVLGPMVIPLTVTP